MAELADFIDDPDFALVPSDDLPYTADETLDAAEDSALPPELAIEAPVLIPLGKTWEWDWERNRFRTSSEKGTAPLAVTGILALQEWLRTLASTAAGAHPALPPEFGVDDPDDFIGLVDPTEAAAIFAERFVESAIANHDRVAAIEDFDPEWDPETGIVSVANFTVTLDDELAVAINDFEVEPET